ncbi:MAG: hypothetical protein J6Y94_06645 [Bacteriovoracaceae bacterium]|nr:hypothetical protein [Bacteriovoracaceae bacterium]
MAAAPTSPPGTSSSSSALRELNLQFYWPAPKIAAQAASVKKVFFLRIAGTGMGAAACLLRDAGYLIEGADEVFYPPMSTYLASAQIKLHDLKTLDLAYLKNFDLVVVGNVIARQSRLAQQLEELGVPFCSFPAALGGLFLKDQNVVAVAGTHGKTTTTFLAAQVWQHLGLDPGYLIGGVLPQQPSSHRGDGRYFFIEADEYDSAYFEKISKFRMYEVDHLILTSLEFDHADIFADVAAIQDQFRAILPRVAATFITNPTYPAAQTLAKEWENLQGRPALTYGQSFPKIIQASPQETIFTLAWPPGAQAAAPSSTPIEFKTNLVGEHNILNLSSVLLFALQEGFAVSDLQKAVQNLVLAKRRQEVRGKFQGAIIIDDFAHHPRAVAVTIKAIQTAYPDRAVAVVFDPHSATARSDIFEQEFAQALQLVKEVCLVPIDRPTSVKQHQDINLHNIQQILQAHQTKTTISSDLAQLKAWLGQTATPQKVILILSNGTCLGLWESDFAAQLEA